MLKRICVNIFILGVITIIYGCSTFRNLFPLEHFYYPVFGNGYQKKMIITIKYTNGEIINGEIPPEITSWERDENLIFESISVSDINKNLIASYLKEYLDKEREKMKVKNEFWVAYEEGLVLIPEEYHSGDDWLEYIESIREK